MMGNSYKLATWLREICITRKNPLFNCCEKCEANYLCRNILNYSMVYPYTEKELEKKILEWISK